MSMLENIQTGREHKPPRLLIFGQEGVGKAQPLDAKVLTPGGFVEMGTLKVGDKVIGGDGKAHNILAVFPQGEKEVFRVTFRDGSQTECCDEHLWFTQTRGERDRKYPGSVRTMNTIRKSLKYGTHFNHAVPRVKPVEFEGKGDLPLDPWLLGIYLAEGNCGESSPSISNIESDILERIADSVSKNDKTTISARAIRISKTYNGSGPCDFKKALVQLGLDNKKSDTKFIPKEYLYASMVERLELLRGLSDGDGYVNEPGAVEICTASDQMAQDIVFLVKSLGGSAICNKRSVWYTKDGVRYPAKDSNRINIVFTNDLVPVASEKHLNKWKQPEWMIRHTIRTVESVGKKECQCIVIDALDSLYVTDDFIVTHNSTFGSSAPGAIFVQTEDGLGEINCKKFPLAHTMAEVLAELTALRDEEHDFQTVVIDSVDWLERIIFSEICKEYGVRSIEKADGGFGKGYTLALAHWNKVIHLLQELRDKRNMTIILVAHSKVERFEDPENAAYDRYTPRLHKHATSLLSEWVDAVLFAHKKFRVTRDSADRSIASPIGADGGERVIRTVGSPACIAKNRYGLPAELPLSWQAFVEAYQKTIEAKEE